MPLLETKGAASAQGFGLTLGGAAPVYIEDVFSTWLYTGNGANRSINNGIDLSTKGGLVWIKDRTAVASNALYDTARGANNLLISNNTNAQNAQTDALTAFNTNGFSLGVDSSTLVNASGDNFVSWTFRKQAKFFDVVTYTGNGTTQNISHSLGSAPGFLVVKCTSTSGNWRVYHRSYPARDGRLNAASAFNTSGTENYWGNNSTTVAPTSTQFTVGNASDVNTNGATYVAYLFAHDAGGFGLTGADNVISCGSFTTDGSGNATVSLGYEPQWVLIKQINGADNWYLNDNMRGMAVSGNQPNLSPNLSDAESAGGYNTYPNATGFTASVGIASATYIYIAIRRGPMKTPTTGTSVFQQLTGPALGSSSISVGLPYSYSGPDLLLSKTRESTTQSAFVDRLRGAIPADNTTNVPVLRSESTAAEVSATSNAYRTISGSTQYLEVAGTTTQSAVGYFFRRAPSFFDVVCFTGTGSTVARNHNLGVAPELFIQKTRGSLGSWISWSTGLTSKNFSVKVNLTGAQVNEGVQWIDVSSTTFTLTGSYASNGTTYVAYLFASCPGVSKVGSYTGNGSSQTINCGFTGGARFVMVKRTDSTGNWMVVDTRRGLVAAGDPTLYLNSTAAEVTGVDWVDPDSSGFIVNQESTMNANVNGGTYIFLAIA